MRLCRPLAPALVVFALVLIATLPARADDLPFAFGLSSPAPQECVGSADRGELQLGDGFASEETVPEKNALRAFFEKVAEEPPLAENTALLTGWIGQEEDLETVLAEPARADMVSVKGLAGGIALLRPTHTPATCGSGGCFTPVFVAIGCEKASPLACLSQMLPWGTRALRADIVRFVGYRGENYLEASHCRCEGAGNCFKSATVFRIDEEYSELALEAAATWRLDSVLMQSFE